MRTLVVIHSLKMGGMERVAINLADAFDEAGHESHLMCLKDERRELAPTRSGVHLHRHHRQKRLLVSGIGAVVFLVSRLMLSVLVRRSHYLWTGWFSGWLLARHIRRLEKRHGPFDRIVFRGLGTFKYLWGFHDSRSVYVLENVLHDDVPVWHQNLQARLLLRGRHLVAVSSGVADSLNERLNQAGVAAASVQVITNPCPMASIRQAMLADDTDIPEEPFILNVARLVPQKGHDLLLEAYARVNPREKLVIIGEGPERSRLEVRVRELGLEGRVLLPGLKENPYPWMHHARLFALSSRYEGLGIVLFEALACGTPVVSVDCPGGVRDVFQGDLARWLAPFSVEGLAERMEEALDGAVVAVQPEWLEPFRPETVVAHFLAPPG